MISPTFLITYYCNPELLKMCLDSIKRFYSESIIIVSQQIEDDPIEVEGFDLIYHDMINGVWADAAIGLFKECKTEVAVFMECDAFLLKHFDNYIELIHNGTYDLIGPEEVIPLPNLNRNSPGMVAQNFFIINAKKMQDIGLDKVRFRDGEEYKDFSNKESGYGISQSLEKKLFLSVTKSNYACGTYYGDFVHHLWYGSYRKRPTYSDGVEPSWMESEVEDLVNDYNNKTFRTVSYNNNLSPETIKLPSSESNNKYAVCIIAHKEADIIGPAIKQWKGLVDKILVLVSVRAWNGSSTGDDGTISIANELADEVVVGEWKTEEEQRSWGLARLYDYDYVIMIDPDEFFTLEDRKKIISELDRPIHLEYTSDFQNLSKVPAFKYKKILTYWKTLDYILDPPDEYKNTIIIDPKQLYCYEHRQYKPPYSEYATTGYAPEIDVTMHHLSWVKTDEKVYEKIHSFSHAQSIFNDWYENIWRQWEPGTDIQVRPYGTDRSKVIYKPAPKDIVNLIENVKV